MTIRYTFLPWVRQHAAAAIGATDGQSVDARFITEVSASAKALDANDIVIDTAQQPAAIKLRWLGPGDVTGIDAREVIRTEPANGTSEFEPNYFPHVEFDRPDFPWLFTPFKSSPSQKERLRPWICLIVVAKRPGIELKTDAARPLPVLSIDRPEQELPNLRESWAWAHASIARAQGVDEPIDAVLTEKPERNLSRLICGRRLQPKTSYYACVVPTFDVGRRTGLGEALPELDKDGKVELKPAWPEASEVSSVPILLPVYYQWEFTTGVAGDFEALVNRLQRRKLDPLSIGTFEVDVSQAGYGLPDVGMRRAEGALCVSVPPIEAIPVEFSKRMGQLVDDTGGQASLGVAPPLYGCWHAGQRQLAPDRQPASSPPAWLATLNLEPRYRLAAGIGARVIQQNQEQLMAAAWNQVADIRRANQLLRQAQLAREASSRIYLRHFAGMSAESMLAITRPVHTRVRNALTGLTIHAELAKSPIKASVLSTQFRRLTRARGPVARRIARLQPAVGTAAMGAWTARLIQQTNMKGKDLFAPKWGIPAGMVSPDGPRTLAGAANVINPTVARYPSGAALSANFDNVSSMLKANPTSIDLALSKLPSTDDLRRLAVDMKAQQTRMIRDVVAPLQPKPSDLAAMKSLLVGSLKPEANLSARVKSRIAFAGASPSQQDDDLETIMVAPHFPQAMHKHLAAEAPNFLLPGLENVPNNVVSGLETNQAFVEAFMVGLNHEMSRELLWREYPTDQRGTYFRYFWKNGDAESDVPPDIDDLHRWKNRLGHHTLDASAGLHSVLLIRGDLMVRYPSATVYAAVATWNGTVREPAVLPAAADTDPAALSQCERYPLFHGGLPPDVGFYGFDLAPDVMRGSDSPSDGKPGWFFVVQQQPTEPRFGLNETNPELPTGDWGDISWLDVHLDSAQYVRVAPGYPKPTKATLVWDETITSAALAVITLQNPFRIAIHASDLLPKT